MVYTFCIKLITYVTAQAEFSVEGKEQVNENNAIRICPNGRFKLGSKEKVSNVGEILHFRVA